MVSRGVAKAFDALEVGEAVKEAAEVGAASSGAGVSSELSDHCKLVVTAVVTVVVIRTGGSVLSRLACSVESGAGISVMEELLAVVISSDVVELGPSCAFVDVSTCQRDNSDVVGSASVADDNDHNGNKEEDMVG